MIPPGKDWVDLLQGFLTPTIAVTSIYFAWAQHKLNEDRFRHERYEKRYAKFEAVRWFIASVVKLGEVTNEERRKFFSDTAGSSFLFGPEIQQYLDDLHDRSVRLSYLQREAERTGDRDKALVGETILWFNHQFEHIEKLYYPYLKVTAK